MKKELQKIIVTGVVVNSVLFAGGDIAPVAPIVAAPVPIPMAIPIVIGGGLIWGLESRDCVSVVCSKRVKDNSFGGVIKAEYEINDYIGLEARAYKDGISNNFAETTHYGIYLKPKYPITSQSNIYGLIGYGHTKVECDIANATYTRNGISFGAGAEYNFLNSPWGVWSDYMNIMNDSGEYNSNNNVVSIGGSYHF